jgi:MFS family permease
MYSESDLNAAVEAGAIPASAAENLRRHVAAQRNAPAVDEEHFRLLSGFNDIFVAVALALLLAAISQIGATITEAAGGLGVAVASWFLAEYFTRRRRMALPSILLLLAFVGGVAATLIGVLVAANPDLPDWVDATIAGGIGLIAATAAWLHWRRFMVPITVAAGALGLVAAVTATLVISLPDALEDSALYPLLLVGGCVLFAAAMRWDMSDTDRRTRRSDVAFWLHLAAAPLIAHSMFRMLGVFDADIGAGVAAIVIALYVAFGFVALAVDRRALLVSSLAYVLYALYALFRSAGAVELGAAFTGLVIGSALLTLSAFWQPMRRMVVGTLGSLSAKLPPVAMA